MENKNLDIAYKALDLIRVCFEKPSEPPYIPDSTEYEPLYAVSKSLGITALSAYALKKQGVIIPDYEIALARAQQRSLLLDAEYKRISEKLTASNIRHVPVKGIVIKKLYPAVGLREMSDIDIWFDDSRAEDVRRIMTDFGYETVYFETSKHDVYIMPPRFCVEMHRRLVDDDVIPASLAYYREKWDTLTRDCGNGCESALSHEDTYVYEIVHAYKHYLIAGIGVRLLLDVRVMLDKWSDDLDMAYIEQECRKLGVVDFEKLVRRISLRLFERKSLSQEDTERLDEFLSTSVHGSMKRYYANAIDLCSNKRSYVFSRLKMTDKQLEGHPVLIRHRSLRPLYFPVRLAKALIERPKLLRTEIKTLYRHKNNGDK